MAARKRQRIAESADSIFLGTPFSTEVAFVPAWKQEARDERGRKRFHGAFTGGFSAGYFNTVGSKEGWTPSSFSSSRTDRAEIKTFTPEDFMDEEDLADMRSSETLVAASAAQTGTSATRQLNNTVLSLGDMLLRPQDLSTSKGAALLQRMGWKPGYGIGTPRDTMIEGRTVRLPPKDTVEVTRFSHKSDMHGLGYDEFALGEPFARRASVQSILPPPGTLRAKKTKNTNKGMGSGVLIDYEDLEEDEDPYEIKPVMYDNRISLKSKSKLKSTLAKHSFTSKSRPSTRIVCNDGRAPLTEFQLSTQSPSDPSFCKDYPPPPPVPEDYKIGILVLKDPMTTITPQLVASFIAAGGPDLRLSATAPQITAPRASLTPSQRTNMLDPESALRGKSVFDYLKPEQRDKIARLTGKNDLPPARSEAPPVSYSNKTNESAFLELAPPLSKSVAASALSSAAFLPYADNPAKRTRYVAYLEAYAGSRPREAILAPLRSEMLKDEWMTELNEFQKSAMLFKPLSGSLANRFTSSASAETTRVSVVDHNTTSDDAFVLKQSASKSDAQHAASLGMYGSLTRSLKLWTPARLLCKRFGVRPPLSIPPSTTDPHPSSISHEPGQLVSSDVLDSLAKEAQLDLPQKSGIMPDINRTLEMQKPPDSLFAAIFGSSDEED
ncbi:uncharacterized protein V1518DRAFT_456111 [Limtongia smithiae]|uniref:uncharacterized protein n=1 Tax=Limtongia smithiae TaxID=1125753 RepID=UPI0034CE0F25